MRDKLLASAAGARTFALVFESGDEVMPLMLEWATGRGLTGASFAGIGAFREVVLGYFDLEVRDYLRVTIAEQVEVLSLAGNVALADGRPKLHAHIVVGKRDGTAHGGHLIGGVVRPTLELVVTETNAALRRRIDAATGLPLLDLDA